MARLSKEELKQTFMSLSNNLNKRIVALGKFIDIALDNSDIHELQISREHVDSLLEIASDEINKTTLYYFMANVCSGIRAIEDSNRQGDTWVWANETLEHEIYYFRKAKCLIDESNLSFANDLPSRVLTNLGNLLNNVGRFAEAIELFDFVVAKFPNFGMARGSRGLALLAYARNLSDPSQSHAFACAARNDLEESLNGNIEHHARKIWEDLLAKLENSLEAYKPFTAPEDTDRAIEQPEHDYKVWVLHNRLFLNPMNDLYRKEFAAEDNLILPAITVPLGEPPHLLGFFSQMKQEFVSARFMLFGGLASKVMGPHYADRNVVLCDTLDYPNFSIFVEKLKMAFAMGYSLLDKIAYFMNYYMKLGIRENDVTIRRLWTKKKNGEIEIRDVFRKLNNRSFQGLCWLSKDFVEEKEGYQETIEPIARELRKIRNHILHKYLKVHDNLWSEEMDMSFLTDQLCFSIKRDDLEQKTLKLMKLIRMALICLVLGVHCEEQKKKLELQNTTGKVAPPMHLQTLLDDFKL